MPADNDPRVKRWESRTAGPLTVLAVLFLLIYALPILWTTTPAPIRQACTVGNVLIWILFGQGPGKVVMVSGLCGSG